LVIEAEDAVKGNTQSNPLKKAILETNYKIEVPMFVKKGDRIIVSTETGQYIKKDNK
jgi:elongation factor P